MQENMRLGFIGTGTITEAIITGILGGEHHPAEIVVSPRGASTAERLAKAHPLVRIGKDNKDVVDHADMLFLAIRPQVAEEVVRPLAFHKGQVIVSLIAATSVETLSQWTGTDVDFIRAVPLPFVAERSGVTALYPPHPLVAEFFSGLGSAVECETAAEYQALTASSALMGTYFGILERAADWLEDNGLPADKARNYLVPLFAKLGQRALQHSHLSPSELRNEFSTRGGLNEQLFSDFDRNGGSTAMIEALNGVLARIRS